MQILLFHNDMNFISFSIINVVILLGFIFQKGILFIFHVQTICAHYRKKAQRKIANVLFDLLRYAQPYVVIVAIAAVPISCFKDTPLVFKFWSSSLVSGSESHIFQHIHRAGALYHFSGALIMFAYTFIYLFKETPLLNNPNFILETHANHH